MDKIPIVAIETLHKVSLVRDTGVWSLPDTFND